MTEQNKQRLLVSGLILAGLVILWLLLRQQSVPAQATAPVETNQGSGSPITYGDNIVGPTNISNPGLSIPGLSGTTMPSFSFNAGSTTPACCSSCGCDSTSPVNQFAAGVGAALSNYAQQMNTLEANTQQQLFGSLPASIAQYVSVAAPSSPVAVIGA